MTFECPLIPQRDGILEIGAGRGAGGFYFVPSTPFDKRLGQFQITWLARHAVQFDQGHLQLGMAAEAWLAVRPRKWPGLVGRSAGDVEESGLAGGGLVFQGGFDQVTQHVAVMLPSRKPGPTAAFRCW